MIIAIDGPAASGKGTLGKRLAQHYGYRHLDTGVIYRAVAKALLDGGHDLTDEAQAVKVAMAARSRRRSVDPELKSHRIGEAASVVSVIAERARGAGQFSAPVRGRSAGRRARRPRHRNRDLPGRRREDFRRCRPARCAPAAGRWKRCRGARPPTRRWCWRTSSSATSGTQNRAAAPLKAAVDAHILDNSNLDIEGGVRAAIAIVEAVRAGR